MQMKGTIRLVLAAALLLAAASPGACPGVALRRKDHGRAGPGPSARHSEHGQDRPAAGPAAAARHPFRDETGKTVKLGDYFGKHPVILSLVYYQCQILCMEDLNGLVGALEMVKLTPGKDFQIVIVSIDPAETPAIAAAKKASMSSATAVRRRAPAGTS